MLSPKVEEERPVREDRRCAVISATSSHETEAICPACSAGVMGSFLDLGRMPVQVGTRWRTMQEARACPQGAVRLAFCPNCSFVGNVAFRPEQLDYSNPYDNDLGSSAVYREFERELAQRLVATYGIRGKRVLEIGCGSGSFVRAVCAAGDNRGWGYDPTLIHEGLDPDGRVEFIADYYPGADGPKPADLIACRQVFEHVPQPLQFLRGLRQTLNDRPDTVLYFEVPSFDDILRRLTFWTIVYEHCSYFGRDALAGIFSRCGFEILNVTECYGDTFLAIEARPSHTHVPQTPYSSVDAERMSDRIMSFLIQFEAKLSSWRQQIGQLSASGRRAVGWGAGARAINFFNLLQIEDAVPYVVDINPSKAGSYLPGTGQQVVPPQFLSEYRPDVVIVMNSIYRDEIRNIVRGLGLEVEYLYP